MSEAFKVKLAEVMVDLRVWVGAATFILSIMVLVMIMLDKTLIESASFMQLATLILGGGGFGAAVGFAFQSSAGSKAANERVDKALDVAQQAQKGAGQ